MVVNHLIDPDKDTVVAYSRADGLVEAIVLQDGYVKQVYRDPTQPGGWNVNPLPDAAGVTHMVAGVSAPLDDLGQPLPGPPVLRVFYLRSGSNKLSVASQVFDGGASTTFTTEQVPWAVDATGLQITFTANESLLVAAMTPSTGPHSGDARLWFCHDTKGTLNQGTMTGFSYDPAVYGNWSAVGARWANDFLSPKIYLYLAGGVDQAMNRDPNVHIWMSPLSRGAYVADLQDSRLGVLEAPAGRAIIDVAYLTALRSRWLPTALIWTVLDAEGTYAGGPQLWAVTMDRNGGWVWTELVLPESITRNAGSAFPISTALTPRSIQPKQSTYAWQLLDVFVVADDTLHVLRQVETANYETDTIQPVYTPLIPLQPGVAAMASQAAVSTGNELLVVGIDHELQTLEKDPVSGRWTDAEIQVPAEELQQDSAYRVTLTLTDVAWNIPVTDQPLKMTASTPVPATIDGPSGISTVFLGAEPVTVTTDTDGEVMIALLADGLSAPTLTITADGLDQPVTVYPSQAVNAYMTGDKKQKLNGLDPLSAETLTNAKTPDDQTVAPGAAKPGAAADAVAAMTQAATFGAQGATVGRAASSVGRIDGGRTHRQARHGHPGKTPTKVGVEGLISGIDHWGHDALHAIKKGAVSVEHIAVDVEKKIVTIASDFTQWADKTVSIIVHSIEDAAHVLHAAFNKVGAAIVHAVKWLEAEIAGLLQDSAAVAGHLQTWLEGCCGFLSTEIAAEKQAAHTWLVTQETAITKKFDAIRAGYGDKVTLANLATNPPLAVGSRRPKMLHNLQTPKPGLGDDNDDDQSSPHGDWFYRKVKHALRGSGLLTPALPGVGFNTMITNLVHAVEGALSDFAAGFKDFWQAIEDTVTKPSKAGSVGVAKLLEGVSHMLHGVFTLANAVVDALFDLFAALATTVTTMLTTDLGSIAIIGELFKLAHLGKLHIGSVANMIFAFPATVAYKIAHGSQTRPFAGLAEGVRPSGRLGDAAQDLKFVAVAAMGTWAGFDTVAASYIADKKEPPLVISAIDIAAPILITALTAPTTQDGEPLFAAPVSPDNHDSMNFFSWILGTVPALSAAASTYVDHAVTAKTLPKEEANTIKDSLAWVMCGGGVFSLVTGMIATSFDDKPASADYAVAVLNNIPPISSPALTEAAVEATVAISAVIACLLTAFCGAGGAVAYGFTKTS